MFALSGRKVLVVGMARSGIATVNFLVERGAQVTGCDIKNEEELGEEIKKLKSLPVKLETGGYPEVMPGLFDLVVVSPGVPASVPPIRTARKLGIPVWSELELAGRFIKEPIIAVTGTNGKTTTTSLLGYIFKKAGINAVVAGNIGIPVVQEVARCQNDSSCVRYWILEVSSFQLEAIENWRPHIAIFLNLTADHLDRHGTLDEYGRTKSRIFENQQMNDYAVLNLNDTWVSKIATNLNSNIYWFSSSVLPGKGMGVREKLICFNNDGKCETLCPVQSLKIPGLHNLENALAASLASLLAGLRKEVIADALATFNGVPHRLELVRVLNDVKYVNDSKGTNPDSVLRAIESYQEPIILIAGGRNKGGSFEELARKIKERVKALILIGEAAPLIKEAVVKTGFRNIYEVSSLAEAVHTSTRLARAGDIVLLSPGCASWDMFNNYEERGDLFRQLVNDL